MRHSINMRTFWLKKQSFLFSFEAKNESPHPRPLRQFSFNCRPLGGNLSIVFFVGLASQQMGFINIVKPLSTFLEPALSINLRNIEINLESKLRQTNLLFQVLGTDKNILHSQVFFGFVECTQCCLPACEFHILLVVSL